MGPGASLNATHPLLILLAYGFGFTHEIINLILYICTSADFAVLQVLDFPLLVFMGNALFGLF